MSFLLDTMVPSELARQKPDHRIEQWLTATDDALLWRNSRTTDSPGAAKSAESLIRLTPRPAACALPSTLEA